MHQREGRGPSAHRQLGGPPRKEGEVEVSSELGSIDPPAKGCGGLPGCEIDQCALDRGGRYPVDRRHILGGEMARPMGEDSREPDAPIAVREQFDAARPVDEVMVARTRAVARHRIWAGRQARCHHSLVPGSLGAADDVHAVVDRFPDSPEQESVDDSTGGADVKSLCPGDQPMLPPGDVVDCAVIHADPDLDERVNAERGRRRERRLPGRRPQPPATDQWPAISGRWTTHDVVPCPEIGLAPDEPRFRVAGPPMSWSRDPKSWGQAGRRVFRDSTLSWRMSFWSCWERCLTSAT